MREHSLICNVGITVSLTKKVWKRLHEALILGVNWTVHTLISNLLIAFFQELAPLTNCLRVISTVRKSAGAREKGPG